MTPRGQKLVAEQRQEGQGPPNTGVCQTQGSCLQGAPEPQEARLNHDFGPEDWMGGCVQARERLWAFPGQVVSYGL